jgi:APA family basic amino acid/polyamine antiporter
MIGAGIFAALAPAAAAAGSGILVALGVAAAVALCNATSSAQLAAVHPESGGAYVYGRRRLGRPWGFLAGWAFVVGKVASCAAIALTFGAYTWPAHPTAAALAAVAALTAVDYRGVAKTVALTKAIVAVVVLALAVVVVAGLAGDPQAGRLRPLGGTGGVAGVLEAAGILFFAFAGYARVATLGEEVRDPSRTIPRAIPLALGITLAVYAAVAATALAAVGAPALATAQAPLARVVGTGPLDALAPVVRVGAAVASLGVLLSLLAGVSRTAFAMAAEGELPRPLAAVHDRHRVPHRAQFAAGAAVAVLVAAGDLRSSIGFSSFGVLVYYGVANASALRLRPAERRWPRGLALAGLAGCAALAVSLPVGSVVSGVAVIAAGMAAYGVVRASSA